MYAARLVIGGISGGRVSSHCVVPQGSIGRAKGRRFMRNMTDLAGILIRVSFTAPGKGGDAQAAIVAGTAGRTEVV